MAVNLGGRVFADFEPVLNGVDVASVLTSDLDGDGQTDLYVVSPSANIALLGNGAGRFVERTARLGLEDTGLGVAAERVDVDGDSLDDLLLHNAQGDVVFWWSGSSFQREQLGFEDTSTDPRALAPLTAAGGSSGGGGLLSPGLSVGPGGAPSLGSGGTVILDTRVGGFGGRALPADPLTALVNLFDERYVNDDANEVDAADVADGSLTGDDVSTSSDDVTMTGGRVG